MRRFISLFFFLLTCTVLWGGSVIDSAQAASRLIIARDSDTPLGRFVSLCQADVPLLKLQFSADVDRIQVTDFYVVTIDPVSKQIVNTADNVFQNLTLDYGSGKVTAVPVNGLVHFALGNNSGFIVPQNGNTTATITATFTGQGEAENSGKQVHLATIPAAAAGGTFDPADGSKYVSGTIQGVRARFMANGSLIQPGSVSGESYDFVTTKSKPTFIPLARSSYVLIPGGQQELYRFSVTADSCGNVELGNLTFDVSVNNTNLTSISLYDLNNLSAPLNSFRPDVMVGSGSATLTLQLDKNAPSSGEVIGAGTVKTYVLKADIEAVGTSPHTVSTRLSGESVPFSKGTYASLSGSANIVWSDVAQIPHGLTNPASTDWMSGNLFFELPTDYLTLSDRSSDFQINLQVALSPNNPSAATLSSAAEKIRFTSLRFTAPAGSDVTLYQFIVHRTGSGNATNFRSVWLESDQKVISAKQKLTGDAVVLTLDRPFLIPVGSFRDIYIMATMDPASSGENALGLLNQQDVFSSANNLTLVQPVMGLSMRTVVGSTNNNGNQNRNNNDNTNNQAPVIQSLSGSSNLAVGQEGSWTVVASDPEGSSLLASVTWGDGSLPLLSTNFKLTHAYTEAGIYEIKVTVQDVSDLTVQKSWWVRVGNLLGTLPPAAFHDPIYNSSGVTVSPFPDIGLSSPLGQATLELYRRAVVSGYADGTFQGNRLVNRAEALKMILVTRYGYIIPPTFAMRFPDILANQWYTKYVLMASNLNIVQGFPDGMFKPAQGVNTAEFLKMLTLAFGLSTNLPSAYQDVQASDWFAAYAGVAQKYNLFPDRTGNLSPGRELTRTEVAIAIYQYLKNR